MKECVPYPPSSSQTGAGLRLHGRRMDHSFISHLENGKKQVCIRNLEVIPPLTI